MDEWVDINWWHLFLYSEPFPNRPFSPVSHCYGKKKIIEEMIPPVNDAEECKMSQLNIISESGFCSSSANEQSFERINKINDGDR